MGLSDHANKNKLNLNEIPYFIHDYILTLERYFY